VQFQLVFDIGIAGQHRHVLREVSLAERMGKHLGRRAPDQRRLVPLAATLDQGLIDHHIAPFDILDEEHHVRQSVEQPSAKRDRRYVRPVHGC
jgi:hypothetical protein